MRHKERYKEWAENLYFDAATRQELMDIQENEMEIEERFYKDLEFGTGGLRGILGAGTNRINIYTVGRATQGFADFLKEQNPKKELSIAIAFDSRNQSPELAERTGLVMAANGIKAYIFDELRPTPQLSFAVRYLGCDGGIVITASHNPPEYNGYKVYGADGGQVPYPKDEMIIKKVNGVQGYAGVKAMSLEEAKDKGLYEIIGKELDDAYMAALKKESLNPEIIQRMGDKIKIVYTPLHGSGNKPVRRILKEVGFQQVLVVPEQELPDQNFSTVGYPNPEDPKVFQLAIKLAKDEDADVIIGTDPDADRIGVVVKDNQGDYVTLNGNMIGVLLTEYILSQKQAKGMLKTNSGMLKTIVTTDMVLPIAKAYGAEVFNVLTGFKYIGEKIKEFEETGNYSYVFGFEESYGCLCGTYARDKDAVSASMLIGEMVAFYKEKNMTLYEGLMALYDQYGYYQENVKAITLQGIEGIQKIESIMQQLRDDVPTEFAGKQVEWIKDYTKRTFVHARTKETEENTLPPSNVLYYSLEEDAWVCVRPSGTEPKIKIYYGVKGKDMKDANAQSRALEEYLEAFITKL